MSIEGQGLKLISPFHGLPPKLPSGDPEFRLNSKMIMLLRKLPLEGQEQSLTPLQKKLPSEKPEWKNKLLLKLLLESKPFVDPKLNQISTLKEQKRMLLKKELELRLKLLLKEKLLRKLMKELESLLN